MYALLDISDTPPFPPHYFLPSKKMHALVWSLCNWASDPHSICKFVCPQGSTTTKCRSTTTPIPTMTMHKHQLPLTNATQQHQHAPRTIPLPPKIMSLLWPLKFLHARLHHHQYNCSCISATTNRTHTHHHHHQLCCPDYHTYPFFLLHPFHPSTGGMCLHSSGVNRNPPTLYP